VAALSGFHWESGPPFAGADRAAFLLGHAWLRLGQREPFAALARAVAAWTVQSPFTRWLAFEARLAGSDQEAGPVARTGSAVADALAASQLLRDGHPETVLELIPAGAARDPLRLWLRAEALAKSGRDDRAELETLAAADTGSALGRDLAGAALIRLATRAAEHAGDPRPLLARVAPGSRYASRARHMSALATLERGDEAAGTAELRALLAADPGYDGRRDAELTLAGLAMDHERWDEALELYRNGDGDWTRQRDALRAWLSPDSAAALWRAWEHDRSAAPALVLDGLPSASLTELLAFAAGGMAADSLALHLAAEPTLGVPDPLPGEGPAVPPPAPADWDRASASARSLAELRGRSALVSDSLARERARLGDVRRYFGDGAREAHDEARLLASWTSRLDSLENGMDATARRLLQLREDATLRFQRRSAWVLARCEAHLAWLGAMEHFYLQGPDGARQAATPPTLKGPDVVLAQELELAQRLRFSANRIHAETPGRLIQAYDRTWGPRLIDRPAALVVGTREALAQAEAIARSADSTLAGSRTSAEEVRLAALATALERLAEQAAASDRALKSRLAGEAVEHALAALAEEREGIDYGLAAATYARSVKLSAADSLPVAATIADGRRARADTLALFAAADSASRHDREEAISRVSIFLADHPGSAARGEMRFRLADLLITAARADFRDRMAAWLRAQSERRALALPVVDHAQALALYRQLLAEDADFPHRDAVLFNAGMLLADAGDPAAGGYFSRLIAEHPGSPYVQEASLRLGDLSLDGGAAAGGVADYERAAAGGDPSLRAIALYKTGWTHYNADRFDAAAQAFQGVLDLFAGDARIKVQADIEHEAEQYFVYSLAAAGGAAAYERVFPAGGPERPYERRVLRAMGQHFRRYGELTNAVAVDALYLRRWPDDPAALDVAARLADTQQRAERPLDERATRLSWAERFAPGGAWSAAQHSDSLRAAGADFARSAWRTEAFEHHREARKKGSAAEWRAALATYETLLARWPVDSAAATYELHAGEACAELGEYGAALRHYRAAALNGRDSVATRAAWQVVAVTDRWYESTRPVGLAAGPKGFTHASATGSDSLARAFMAEVDHLLEREPANPEAANLVWRECQLARAHGWNDQAQALLARFARGFPDDRRAPLAAGERAEALFRAGDFVAAGDAFGEALAIARRAHADTLARRAEKALPVCAFRAAELAAAQDSTRPERQAESFEQVAKRWPEYEHAPVAEYRAGLAWLAAGNTAKGVRALEALAERWPTNALARDAHLKSAQAWEAAGDKTRAADAYIEFSQKHPADDNADEAWLKAVDLCDSSGQGTRADDLRAQYLRRWPNDRESGMEILERLAHHELTALSADRALATLLASGAPAAPRQGAKAVRRKAAPAEASPSHLAQYLKLAAKSPSLASKPLLAEVRFRYGEEAYGRFDAVRLTQPLPKSIAAKQKLLDSVLVRYRRTVDMGVPEWAHASAFRTGQALVAFAEALEKSERPADLSGDDLKAYENVLMEQSMPFHERGETVWSDLVKRTQGEAADAWTTRARESLWARLGDRFLFQPDVDFPVVEASGPGKTRPGRGSRDSSTSQRSTATEGHE